MPHSSASHGRRLPAWVFQLCLAVAAVALALGGAIMLADRQWMTGTVSFGLAVLAALIAALVGKPSRTSR